MKLFLQLNESKTEVHIISPENVPTGITNSLGSQISHSSHTFDTQINSVISFARKDKTKTFSMFW